MINVENYPSNMAKLKLKSSIDDTSNTSELYEQKKTIVLRSTSLYRL